MHDDVRTASLNRPVSGRLPRQAMTLAESYAGSGGSRWKRHRSRSSFRSIARLRSSSRPSPGLVGGLDRRGICYELLLVEQFSDQRTLDTSLEVVNRFPHVRHMVLPTADFGHAMRVGMLEARGSVIVNFDIDYWDIYVRPDVPGDDARVRHRRGDRLEERPPVGGQSRVQPATDLAGLPDRPASRRSACASATLTASKRGIAARA